MSLFKGVSTTTRADKINQFQSTICEYGAVVPDIVGTTKIAPNLINWQDFYTKEISTTTKQGKAKSTTINYDYYVYLELALAESISGIGAVWVGDKKYASLLEANTTSKAEGFPLVLYRDGGCTDYMRQYHSDLAVEYTNLAFLASPTGGNASATYLGENNASTPSYAFEVRGETSDGVDLNPADYILHILKVIGLWDGAIGEENIVEGIGRYRQYCAGMDMLVSSPKEASRNAAQNIIKDLMDLTDSYFFWSNNRFKIVVKDNREWGEFKPDKTIIYDLDANDMIAQSNGACVLFSRKDSSEQYNRFTIKWCNRSKDYEDETISYELVDDILVNGLKQASSVSAPYIYTTDRAIKACQLQARKTEREKNKYTIKLDWAYALLEPGDLITLTDDIIGLQRQPVIVDKVTEGKDGILTVECLQYYDGDYPLGKIDVNNDEYFYVNYNAEPDPTDTPVIFQPPSEATLSGNEIWIALRGTGSAWGGCSVIAANQDSGYYSIAEFRSQSQYGRVVSFYGSSMTLSINGEFDNLTAADGKKLYFWVNGELISYITASYNADGTWTFGTLTRHLYDTGYNADGTEVWHSAGEQVVWCNGALFAVELSAGDEGQTYYFKFPAMNLYHNNYQSEEDCMSYSFTVGSIMIPLTGENKEVSLEGSASVTGGAVTLDRRGLTCEDSRGYKVLFNYQGMSFVDANGNTFSAVKRIVMGEANHGQWITFTKPFDRSPLIICNPKVMQVSDSGYSASNVFLVCQAVNVSPQGFLMNCYTMLGSGSSNQQVIGYDSTLEYSGGIKGYYQEVDRYWLERAVDYYCSIPYTATVAVIDAGMYVHGSQWYESRDSGDQWGTDPSRGRLIVYVDGIPVYDSGYLQEGTYENGGNNSLEMHNISINFRVGATIFIRMMHRIYSIGHGYPDIPYARFVIRTIEYNTTVDNVINAGRASFIAADTDEYYG